MLSGASSPWLSPVDREEGTGGGAPARPGSEAPGETSTFTRTSGDAEDEAAGGGAESPLRRGPQRIDGTREKLTAGTTTRGEGVGLRAATMRTDAPRGSRASTASLADDAEREGPAEPGAEPEGGGNT